MVKADIERKHARDHAGAAARPIGLGERHVGAVMQQLAFHHVVIVCPVGIFSQEHMAGAMGS